MRLRVQQASAIVGLRPVSFNPCSAPASPVQTWGTRPGPLVSAKSFVLRRCSKFYFSRPHKPFRGLPGSAWEHTIPGPLEDAEAQDCILGYSQPSLRDCSLVSNPPRISSWATLSRPFGTKFWTCRFPGRLQTPHFAILFLKELVLRVIRSNSVRFRSPSLSFFNL